MEVTPEGKVKDFEVGVFCGKYKTEVPEGYFEHLNEVRGKKRKMAEDASAGGPQTVVASSGPVNVAKRAALVDGAGNGNGVGLEHRTPSGKGVDGEPEDKNAGMANPNNRQDIRYVLLTLLFFSLIDHLANLEFLN